MTDLMSRPDNYRGTHEADAGDRDDNIAPPPPPAPPTVMPPNGGRRWPRRLASVAAVLVLVAGGGTAGGVLAERYLDDHAATTSSTSSVTSTTSTSDSSATATDSLAGVVKAVEPSIVTITVKSMQSESIGSGVIISSDGLIVTNYHVVSGGGTLTVELSSGKTLSATVVATDTTNDLALVQASDASGLTAATFATDDSVAVGDTVLAFGAPLGLENTVTSGIVSALDRSVDTGDEKLTGLIQTDAAINQGNSGGALVDTDGHIIGINVAIATTSQSDSGSIGVGFAITADTVVKSIKQMESQIKN